MRLFENLSSVKIDLPTVPLDQVHTVALTFAKFNRSLFNIALFPFVAGLISSIKGIHKLAFIQFQSQALSRACGLCIRRDLLAVQQVNYSTFGLRCVKISSDLISLFV